MFRLVVVLLALLAAALPGPARAIEVKCIEASKYQYLWQLFDNDPRRLAAYSRIDSARLPSAEFCRAAVVTGPMEKEEVGKLVDFVLANQGWLATLYLDSGGGSVAQGVMLSLVTRMFWLKTRASYAKPVVYEPDFALPPLDARASDAAEGATGPQANWRKFAAAVKSLPQPTPGNGTASCGSSCSMMFSAGIDRRGVVFLHRPRISAAFTKQGLDPEASLSKIMESLQGTERLQVALYEQMDSGENFIRSYRTTMTNIVVPATTTRLPAYVSDLLLQACGSDVTQLQDLETQTRSAINYIGWSGQGFVETDRLRLALRQIHERQVGVEACVAALHEKERLKRYDRVCAAGCTRETILDLIRKEFLAVVARATPPRPPQPEPPVRPASR